MIIRTGNLEETYDFAKVFLARLRPYSTKATVVALQGDLGAGKTSFTQGLAKALGILDVITSPTFVIEKIYQIPGVTIWRHLIHIDCYRLSGSKELQSLGFNDLLKEPGNLLVLEWPEKVADLLPPELQTLHFTFIDETIREIKYEEN